MVALRLRPLIPVAAALAFSPLLSAPPAGAGSLDVLPPLPWLTQPLAALAVWAGREFDAPSWLFPLAALLIHLANAGLLGRVLDPLLAPRAATVAALLFAVHPIQTETLILDSARGLLLAGFFVLLTLRLWLALRPRLALAAFACALACSPAAAAVPVLVFLLGRARSPAPARRAFLLPMAALAAAAAALHQPAPTPRFQFLAFQGVAMLRSLWLSLFPLGLTPDPEVRTGPLAAALAWGAVAALAALSFSAWRRRGASLWILGGLVLLLFSSLDPAPALAADHRMYLPMICFSAALGMALELAPFRLLALYAGILCLLSAAYSRLWQNEAALWMEAARMAPLKTGPKRALAPYLPPAQAVEILIEASRLEPSSAAVAADLGFAFLRAGKPYEAMAEFDRALAHDPHLHAALAGRAQAWLALGRQDAASSDLQRALALEPCSLAARLVLPRAGQRQPPAQGCRWSALQRRALALATSR